LNIELPVIHADNPDCSKISVTEGTSRKSMKDEEQRKSMQRAWTSTKKKNMDTHEEHGKEHGHPLKRRT